MVEAPASSIASLGASPAGAARRGSDVNSRTSCTTFASSWPSRPFRARNVPRCAGLATSLASPSVLTEDNLVEYHYGSGPPLSRGVEREKIDPSGRARTEVDSSIPCNYVGTSLDLSIC